MISMLIFAFKFYYKISTNGLIQNTAANI